MKLALRRAPLVLCLLLGFAAPAVAQVSIHFNVPAVQLGVNLGGYPTLQRVPGYPVYYAPNLDTNYFFYDGMYWIYERDNWYASSWYNGPWGLVEPIYVPDYLLRVPVRYYRHAPVYFRGWRADAPPRWHEHWGHSWHERRRDWDRWDRRSAPAPAPLPTYQRQYRGDRYPDPARQALVESQHYRYQPREEIARRHFEERRQERAQERREQRRDERIQERRVGEQEQRIRPAEGEFSRSNPTRGNQDRGSAEGRSLNKDHSGG
ncbi:MAG TPA: hypothetical protein VFK48_09045 [Usitatibacter sp.]|nr:hypothetical protein [Usitatibacter sp.]